MSDWDACTLEPNTLLRWIECHPGTAGWIQAIFSVAAILIAIAIPTRQRVIDRRAAAFDKQERTKNLLVAIAGDVFTLGGSLVVLRADVERLKKQVVRHEFKFSGRSYVLTVPSRLDSALFMAVDLDEKLIAPFVKFMIGVHAYNGFVENLGAPSPTADELKDIARGLSHNLVAAERHHTELMAYYRETAT